MHDLTRRLASYDDAVSNCPTSLRSSWKNRDPHRSNAAPVQDGIRSSFARLRDDWIGTFRHSSNGSDLISGMTVAAVALPLNVALAVACGLPPAVGLVSGAIGGATAAIFGGSSLQVTGPAAALGLLVLGLANRWGVAGAAAGAICVGLVQFVLFAVRSGRFMKFVPEAVLAGFTTGVGLKLLDQQIPLLFDVSHSVAEMAGTLADPSWLKQVRWTSVVSGLVVVLFMLGLARYRKVPAAIFGLAIVGFVSHYLGWDILRVGAMPSTPPHVSIPDLPASEWFALFLACIPLGVLASAESLISASSIDRMTESMPGDKKPRPHAPNLEIFGQGMANVATGFFGGMPVSGVIVRSSVNLQAGGKSRLSSLVHGALLLAAPIFVGEWIAKIPLAALAGLLCLVGYRLVEISTFFHLWKEKPRYAVAFVVSAAGVVAGSLTTGLIVALVIAGLPEWIRAYRSRRKKDLKKGPQQNEVSTLPPGVRAKISKSSPDPFTRGAKPMFRQPEENWEAHIAESTLAHPTAFVHPNASVIGRVVLGPHVHVASEAAIRADEGTPFYIGARTNVQDGVVLHALKGKWVMVDGRKWAIHIGERVSLAHQALVHGPCFIGDDTFVGFKAVVHDAVVGRGCSIGIGAIVVGVEIPDERFVPPGTLVDTPEKAAALPPVQPQHRHFNEDVVEVNHGLAEAYRGEWLVPRMPETVPTVF